MDYTMKVQKHQLSVPYTMQMKQFVWIIQALQYECINGGLANLSESEQKNEGDWKVSLVYSKSPANTNISHKSKRPTAITELASTDLRFTTAITELASTDLRFTTAITELASTDLRFTTAITELASTDLRFTNSHVAVITILHRTKFRLIH